MFLKDLENLGFNSDNLFGVDISEKAISSSKKKGLTNTFLMDAQNITLEEKFDIIVASDCLEHLENDEKALSNWKTILHKNGKLFVFVPAFMGLWSYHDAINMHFRRYTKNELRSKIENENLKIIKSSYWNFFLFVPVYILREISSLFNKNKSGENDIKIGNLVINKLFLQLIIFENKLLKRINFPFGVSTFCIAKRVD